MFKSILVMFIILFGVTAFAQKTPILKELTEAELAQLEDRALILKTREVEGSAWPEITLYTLVEARPVEAMGIFSALDYQKDYVPNVIISKPIKHLSATEVLTEYEMHVPFPLSNAHYTHVSIVHQYNEDYELTWYKVESTSTEEAKGSAYFSPYKKVTLFRYVSYIKPKSIFGSLVKKIMLNDVQKTILSIRAHIETLKKENSPILSKYSGFINRAIKGEFVYKDSIDAK
ncbi:MAG: hypothetical protein H7281_18785 [Bacteriovorax sp.]|nr:hypothetical protein [Bacteriovorax sp.]